LEDRKKDINERERKKEIKRNTQREMGGEGEKRTNLERMMTR
jgi:hypothetical protein